MKRKHCLTGKSNLYFQEMGVPKQLKEQGNSDSSQMEANVQKILELILEDREEEKKYREEQRKFREEYR